MAATRLQAEAEGSGWSDAELVRAGADGDRSVFDELYRRHASVAQRVARGVVGNDHDAADAAADAFTRVVDAVISGRAPSIEFRSYLLAATRNAAVDQLRRSERHATNGKHRSSADNDANGNGDAEGQADGPGPPEALAAGEDSQLVTQAFQGLPARWQSVLWLTEVEGVPAREAADVLGLTPNNVSQLAVRARAKLRERYLQAHVRNHAQPQCQQTVDHLGAYLAGTLADGRRARVDAHLSGCAACRERVAEVEDVGVSLRKALAPAPLLLGGVGWLRRRSRQPRSKPTTPAAGLADRATVAVSGSPVFQCLELLPVSAVGVVVAAGPAARSIVRSVASVVVAVSVLVGIHDSGHDPAAMAVASPVSLVATTTTIAQPAPTVAPPIAVAPAADPGPLPATAHRISTVAQAREPVINVYAPDGLSVVGSLDNPQPSGAPLLFLVVEEQPDWLEVLLPIRPNGSTGWLRRQDVLLSNHPFSIVIELGVHRITVFDDVNPILSEPVALGTADTPTPTGLYYTKELIQPTDSSGRLWPDGPYGPYAYGLSGFSDVLESFGGGEGVVGIHGTDDPSVLGHDVSHGCIRMSNEGITKLAGILPLGVPVEIRL